MRSVRTLAMALILVALSQRIAMAMGEGPAPNDVPVTDSDAIANYMNTVYPFSRDLDRTYALSNAKPVDALPFLDRYQHHFRFYYFPTSANSSRGHVAIAVDPLGRVMEVGDPAGFNVVVHTLNFRLTTCEDAIALAKDFLLLTNVHSYYWEGEAGGVNQISRLDDIPFDDDIEGKLERRILAHRNEIAPATCVQTADGYVYRFFSWRPDEGAVYHHIATVSNIGLVQHEKQQLVYAYGKYTTGCSFPLDGGPKSEDLASLISPQDPDSTELVVDYVLMLAQSKHHLYELRLGWLRDEPVLRSSLISQLPDSGLSFHRKLEQAVKALR